MERPLPWPCHSSEALAAWSRRKATLAAAPATAPGACALVHKQAAAHSTVVPSNTQACQQATDKWVHCGIHSSCCAPATPIPCPTGGTMPATDVTLNGMVHGSAAVQGYKLHTTHTCRQGKAATSKTRPCPKEVGMPQQDKCKSKSEAGACLELAWHSSK